MGVRGGLFCVSSSIPVLSTLSVLIIYIDFWEATALYIKLSLCNWIFDYRATVYTFVEQHHSALECIARQVKIMPQDTTATLAMVMIFLKFSICRTTQVYTLGVHVQHSM